jgi:hypothetical protein
MQLPAAVTEAPAEQLTALVILVHSPVVVVVVLIKQEASAELVLAAVPEE